MILFNFIGNNNYCYHAMNFKDLECLFIILEVLHKSACDKDDR